MLTREDDLDGERVEHADLTGQDASGARLLECSFTDCVLDDVRLDGARVLDTSFVRGRATSLSTSRATLRDVECAEVRWGAWQAGGAQVQRLRIVGGRIDLVLLRGADVRDLELVDCRLGELDLTDAGVQRVRTRNARIDRLTLTHARCSGVDLTGAELTQVDGLDGLRGVSVSIGQAVQLAQALAEHCGARVV